MAKKFDIDEIKIALNEAQADDNTKTKVVDLLNVIAKEEELEKEQDKTPKPKKEYIVLNHPNATSTVFQILYSNEDDGRPASEVLIERLGKVKSDFNESKKGKKLPVKNMEELCEFVPQKFFKERNLWKKTKLPAEAVSSKAEDFLRS